MKIHKSKRTNKYVGVDLIYLSETVHLTRFRYRGDAPHVGYSLTVEHEGIRFYWTTSTWREIRAAIKPLQAAIQLEKPINCDIVGNLAIVRELP